MKKSRFTAVLMLTCLFVVGISAHAHGADTVVVSVPFEFVVGGATLPAGKYRVSRVSSGVSQELAIRGDNKENAFMLPLAFDNSAGNQPSLSFAHVGGKYFLSEIKTPAGVYTIGAPKALTTEAQKKATDGLSSSGTN